MDAKCEIVITLPTTDSGFYCNYYCLVDIQMSLVKIICNLYGKFVLQILSVVTLLTIYTGALSAFTLVIDTTTQ